MGNELQTTSPAAIIEAAVKQGTPVEQLQALLDMQMQWEANEARKAFNRALIDFKGNPPEIFKTKEVSFGKTSYRHAELDKVVDIVTPALQEHGLSFKWEEDQGEQIAVSCVLSHVDGHSERVTMKGPPDSSGSKNPLQEVGSTTSYLQRYTLLMILGMAAKGMDNDGRGAIHKESTLITDEQALAAEAFITEHELPAADIAKFLKSKGYDSIAEITADAYDFFVAMLKAAAKSRAPE